MDRRQKKRERNSMPPKEKDEMHAKARNNIKKLRLIMSPKKGRNECEKRIMG
jgi:hypothetical protein